MKQDEESGAATSATATVIMGESTRSTAAAIKREIQFENQMEANQQQQQQQQQASSREEAIVEAFVAEAFGGNNNMVVAPVGGMRRVSSCYFSIASNLSELGNSNNINDDDDDEDEDEDALFGDGNNNYGTNDHDDDVFGEELLLLGEQQQQQQQQQQFQLKGEKKKNRFLSTITSVSRKPGEEEEGEEERTIILRDTATATSMSTTTTSCIHHHHHPDHQSQQQQAKDNKDRTTTITNTTSSLSSSSMFDKFEAAKQQLAPLQKSGNVIATTIANNEKANKQANNQSRSQADANNNTTAITTTTNTTATTTPNILYNHDILMNIFTFLHDANTLAKVSLISKRLNFECFYFLELQLQRALLVPPPSSPPPHSPSQPSFCEHYEQDLPSIPGTGVISRLAIMDNTKARTIVQEYLDSNRSIRGMPLSYSLAYLRQVLRQHSPPNMKILMNMNNNNTNHQQQHASDSDNNSSSNNNNNMVKNARNMALVLTFLGAAYMHQQNGGGGNEHNMLPSLPDPGEVLNDMMTSESVAALKDALLKVGLAGGLVKARATMKKKEEEANNNNNHNNNVDNQRSDRHEHDAENADGQRRDVEDTTRSNNITSSSSTPMLSPRTSTLLEEGNSQGRNNRSSSLGSLEELSQILPTSIASRLRKVLSNGDTSTGSGDTSGVNDQAREEEPKAENPSPSSTPHRTERKHRDKRSHCILRKTEVDSQLTPPDESEVEGTATKDETKTSSFYEDSKDHDDSSLGSATSSSHYHPSIRNGVENSTFPSDSVQEEKQSLESMEYAMDHLFSPNPYDHIIVSPKPNVPVNNSNNNDYSPSTSNPNTNNPDSYNKDTKTPSGCIGAYAQAVKTATTEVTRLIKEQRQANFEALSEDEQIQLGIRFIDACGSNDKLPIVKDLVQVQNIVDVDRFFLGPDETETCALHTAAFNGADQVLEFLCGGIDIDNHHHHYNDVKDGGLCNVNIRDVNGWTALHFAAGANSETAVKILAKHGAKLLIEAGNGYTPYHWAKRLSNEEVALELERLGADNRFVSGWMFGNSSTDGNSDRKVPFVSFLANRFFAFSR